MATTVPTAATTTVVPTAATTTVPTTPATTIATTVATTGGIGTTPTTLSSAATTTAATTAAPKDKPGILATISAFACGIIDSICKAFEKCFASIKGLFVRPAATPTTAATAPTTVAFSAEKQALLDLKAVLEAGITTVSADIAQASYASLLQKPELGGGKLLEALKKKMYELAHTAGDDLKVAGGFKNRDWAGDAIKIDPRNKYAKQALEAMIAAA